MGQEILTPEQRQVIVAVASDVQLAKRFYLTGGTALAAYYLHHRVSDDLDFFSYEPVDGIYIHSFMETVRVGLTADSIRFEKLFDRNLFFLDLGARGELKLEFTRYPFPQLEQPVSYDGILVDHLRDITANKLMAMLDRFDPKDFVDLFFLLKKSGLEEAVRDTETKFGATLDSFFVGSELMKVTRVEALPRMIAPLTPGELREFFISLARNLKPQIIE